VGQRRAGWSDIESTTAAGRFHPRVPSKWLGAGLVVLFSFGDALGVGHNPYALSEVRRSNIGSGNNLPFRIVPARGHGPENTSEESSRLASKEAWDVLQHDKSRSYHANASDDFIK
jgi:hypothetical protein